MKKLILLLTITTLFLFTSCNKDEDDPNAEYDVEVYPPSLFGVWYNRQFINSDGTVVPYVNACTTMRDNLNLKSNYNADTHKYLADCSEGGILNTGYTFLFSINGGSSYISLNSENHKITKLTNKTLQLEHDFINGSGITARRTYVYSRE